MISPRTPSGWRIIWNGFRKNTILRSRWMCTMPVLNFWKNITEIIFVVAAGYATQHMCFALSRMGLYLLNIPYGTSQDHIVHAFVTRYGIFPLAAVSVYFIAVKGNQKKSEFSDGDLRIAVLAAVLLLTAITLSVYWSYDSNLDGNKVGGMICPAYSFICCAFVLVLSYRVLWENSMKREHEKMEEMLRMADIQQKSSKEAIDIINIKCHDLRHQIRLFRGAGRIDESVLKEMEQAVDAYDITVKTGNPALDVLLTEKNQICRSKQIGFTCMADGKGLAYMEPADLYALFGNALENAIEATEQLTDPAQKQIVLTVRPVEGFCSVHLQNYTKEPLRLENGLPVTSKQDRLNHGFGTRSMQLLVEKYGGELTFQQEADVVNIYMLLPSRPASE